MVFVAIVVKDAADPARFPPVRDGKILITVGFHARVVGHGGMAVAGGFIDAVKVARVGFKEIMRRQVRPAAEPHPFHAFRWAAPDYAKVRVDRGRVGIPWVQYETDAGRAELATFARQIARQFFGEGSANVTEVYAPFSSTRPPSARAYDRRPGVT